MNGERANDPKRKYAVLFKRRGETPLEALEAWKINRPELAQERVSYAGRLDPMAEGKILVLLGDECKKQTEYTKLDKEYEIEVLFDLSSDTGDILGLGEYHNSVTNLADVKKGFSRLIRDEQGTHARAYPAFSSKTVKGKPLFLYKLEGTIGEIDIPVHDETIYKIKFLDAYEISSEDLFSKFNEMLSHVSRSTQPSKALGKDFRQDAIRTRWAEIFRTIGKGTFVVLRLRVTCASGTYMRTLAERVGTTLGTTALALSINRTKIGKYQQLPFTGFWMKEFN